MTSTNVAIITDTHFGARNSLGPLLDQCESFFLKQFWPEVKKRGIDRVYHLGDVFDSRKNVSIFAASVFNRCFVRPVIEMGITVDVCLGNHDMAYRDKPIPNSPQEFLHGIPNFRIHDKPHWVEPKVLFVPFPTIETESDVEQALDNAPDQTVIMGHLDIQGFFMPSGDVMTAGLNPAFLKRFYKVLSGHYHHPQKKDNIVYLGSPYQMDWGDAGSSRGFHIFNSLDRTLTRVENPVMLFEKVTIGQKDVPPLKGRFVRLYVKENSTISEVTKYVEKLQSHDPISIKIMDKSLNVSSDVVDVDSIEIEDVRNLISEYIDQLSEVSSKDKLKQVMLSLYDRARDFDVEM